MTVNVNDQDDELDALFGAFDGEPKASSAVSTSITSAAISTKRGSDLNNESGGCSTTIVDDSAESIQQQPQHLHPIEKKQRIDNENDTANAATIANTPNESVNDGEAEEATPLVQDTASVPAKNSVYASVMNKPLPNIFKLHDLESSGQKQPQSQSSSLVEREIATGTSHDKSVRTYSAYPKIRMDMIGTQTSSSAKSNGVNHAATPNSVVHQQPASAAKVYPFELDPFQLQAIAYIEKEESVLVSAHTSAGKTAVAEYAIAKSLQHGQRVIYTSPIKALSNQKYRDLQEEFKDVGLMTGDITINPQATVLVMTTEILRSMLYRGSEILREVAWCVYDEVHYMRDSERGVVWEESIILLPHRVRFVFLSATIPNASQFADWICEIHHQPCHVVYTNYRPVPLQHYIFPQGGDGLHLVVDEQGKFREANFQKAMAALQSGNADVAGAQAFLSSGENSKKAKVKSKVNGGKNNGQFADLKRIVKLIMTRNLNPVIVFSFSKRDCERYALALNQDDFSDDIEKDLVSQVYHNAIESLGDDDRKLPQVEALLPLLKRGIGIHHGGLLPILKEIVEILFAEGLIKILFATETFSIGINMPAKTVVFTNTRKWDGKDFRWVTSGEYIQMSGRAGRRGKDDRGIVIQMLDEKMEPAVCKGILYGEADSLNSSYRISYNMLLNLMRVEDVEPEFLLRASFHQFQRERDAPAVIERSDYYQTQGENIVVGSSGEEAELASQFYQMNQQLSITRRKIAATVRKPEYVLKFLSSGRLLNIMIDGEAFGWGVLVSLKKKQGTRAGRESGKLTELNAGPGYSLDILLNCIDRRFDSDDKKGLEEDVENLDRLWQGSLDECRPFRPDDDPRFSSMRLFTVGLSCIESLSAVKLFVPQDVTTFEGRKKVTVAMKEVKRRLNNNIPLLDPVVDLGITTDDFATLLKRAEMLTERMDAHALSVDYEEKDREKLLIAHETKVDLLEKAKVLRDEARSLQNLSMKDDMKKMKRALKKLGHVDGNGVIQTKGRTACEINTAHELIVVELIFTGVFNDISSEACCSLLSCLIFDDRSKVEEGELLRGQPKYLTNPYFKLKDVARTVARVEQSCGIDVDEERFLEQLNPGLMEAVYAWCKGAKFIEVQKLTGAYEGTTIRTLRRLEELIRQIAAAATAIGNEELAAKFEKADDLLKRDIVFCSSLYL